MTANEAAERLRGRLTGDIPWLRTLDDALAAERVRAVSEHQALCDERVKEHGDAVRRATVERIRERLTLTYTLTVNELAAILVEEAAR